MGATLTKDMRNKFENMRMAAEVYDRHGKLIGNLSNYRRIWTPIEKIPVNLQHAVIAVEDSRFYQHNGVDLRGMARALVKDLIPGGGPLQGGSTITQQLAKVVLLSSERTLERKIQDISYALEIEKNYSKKEIFEFYLNSIYLGHGNVGVEAATRYYFGKSVFEVSLDQMALLAGMIRGPEYYSPFKNPKLARERRNTVLRKMAEQKYITLSQDKSAEGQGLNTVAPKQTASVGAYFLDYVHERLLQGNFTEDELRYGGYDIYTTLDVSMEEEAERSLLGIPQFTAKTQPQAALVTIDPVTGEILAMAGGRNYGRSQLNRAVKSYRQPGSAIKPFIYATALEENFTAASIFEDKPLSIPLFDGTEWRPENYDRTYRGNMTLRDALCQSINSVAVQLLQAVGIEPVLEQIERMGITSMVKRGKNNDRNLASLALGGLTKGVTPLELATAYTAFANQGLLAKPVAILKVLDSHGTVLKEFKPEEPKGVLSPQTAYILTMLLKDAVSQGTGAGARLPDRPAAGKTGTTSDYTNAWFVGYTPTLLTAIWVGNDRQEQPMTYKEGNVGSSLAAKIWGGYMSRVTASLPAADFIEPEGIVWVDIDPETGQAVPSWFGGKSYKEVFNEKNVPEGAVYRFWHWLFPRPKPQPGQVAVRNDLHTECSSESRL